MWHPLRSGRRLPLRAALAGCRSLCVAAPRVPCAAVTLAVVLWCWRLRLATVRRCSTGHANGSRSRGRGAKASSTLARQHAPAVASRARHQASPAHASARYAGMLCHSALPCVAMARGAGVCLLISVAHRSVCEGTCVFLPPVDPAAHDCSCKKVVSGLLRDHPRGGPHAARLRPRNDRA